MSFDEWFRANEEWRSFFKGLLLSEDAVSKKYFNQEYIRKLFYEQVSGWKDNCSKLLHLASFELFLRLFF